MIWYGRSVSKNFVEILWRAEGMERALTKELILFKMAEQGTNMAEVVIAFAKGEGISLEASAVMPEYVAHGYGMVFRLSFFFRVLEEETPEG